jgi:dimethylargininase
MNFIFCLGREFFVGLSKTTNMAGAKAVASAFPEYPVTLLRVLLYHFILFLYFYIKYLG